MTTGNSLGLEEALTVAGMGWFTRSIWLVTSLVNYSGFSSILAMSTAVTASDCDLVLSSYQKAILASMGYLGMLFGGQPLGALADRSGRKKVMMVCLISSGVTSIISSLAPSQPFLIVSLFVNGFLVGGALAPMYVYVCELCPAEARVSAMLTVAASTPLAAASLSGLGWLIFPLELTPRRLFVAITSLPLFLAAFILAYLPESPKFLLYQGLHEQTLHVLKTIYARNSSNSNDQFPVDKVCLDRLDEESKQHDVTDICRHTSRIFSKDLIPYTLLTASLAVPDIGIYSMMMLWSTEEAKQLVESWRLSNTYNMTLCEVMATRPAAGSCCTFHFEDYVPNLVIGCLQLLLFLSLAYIVQFTSRRIVTVLLAATAGAASVAVIFSQDFYLTLACLGAVQALLLCLLPISLSIVVSYYPTSLRSTATSFMLLVGRLVTVIGTHLLGAVFVSNCRLAFAVISSLLLGGGWFTRSVWLVCGLANFAGFTAVQAMSVVVTAASCDLPMSSYQKGLLTSIAYFGMIFSSQLCGVLADSYGRKKVIVTSSVLAGVVTLASSFAPTVNTLLLAFFINGFIAGGVFSPGYVYVSEFCTAPMRATSLIVVASCGALVNAFLPCLAWLVLPFELATPLPLGIVFTSWRLLLALLSFPLFLAASTLSLFPDTPKFLLNQGRHDETLQLLRTIYALNTGKRKEEFPVVSVVLDGPDLEAEKQRKETLGSVQELAQQSMLIFSRPYFLYTLLSCTSIMVVVGIYNVLILWSPEEVRLLALHASQHVTYNVTLCDVMSQRQAELSSDCAINLQAYAPGVVVGILQFFFFYLVDYINRLIGPKLVTVIFSGLSAMASVILIFADDFYLTVACLGVILVLLLTVFPVSLSIVVSYFPTTLRSNATAMVMLFARILSVVGTQLLGAVFQSSCETAHAVISAILLGHMVLCVLMPVKS